MCSLAGVIKLSRPHEQLTEQLGWPGDHSTGMVRFVEAVEALSAAEADSDLRTVVAVG